MKKNLFLIIFIVCYSGCYDTYDKIVFDKIILPKKPVNFAQVNSVYDDYNSDINGNFIVDNFNLYFSSNRDSEGGQFDIIEYYCRVVFDEGSALFEISAYRTWDDEPENRITTTANELGPFFYKSNQQSVLFFTREINGNLDICSYDIIRNVLSAYPQINTTANEAYITYHNATKTFLYCSDEGGDFDICKISESDLESDAALPIEYETILNSPKDDKCPYIRDNLMVFTSKRDGGFGGFDLWYSVFDEENGWSEPENFGEHINTEHDEYRPIIAPTNEDTYLNDFMLFSSNRPGGLGGFDLYYVGIPKNLK